MKSTVIIQFEIEGFHHYPNAPQEVDFLSDKHRHTFDYIKEYLTESYGSPCEFGAMSCEMIAAEILEYASEDGMIWVEVWEEKTGGARIEK